MFFPANPGFNFKSDATERKQINERPTDSKAEDDQVGDNEKEECEIASSETTPRKELFKKTGLVNEGKELDDIDIHDISADNE